MLYREIIADCFEVHTKQTQCGQNVKCFKIQPGGTNSNHWD